MWDHAEIVGLLDHTGHIRVVSRNEVEAHVSNVVGLDVYDRLAPASKATFADGFQRALSGEIVEALLCVVADAGFEFWLRVRMSPAPEKSLPVLFHMRRLPKCWGQLSPRERDAVQELNACGMNAKRAAKRLGVTVNTFNAHRRAICQKCQLQGVGEFWVFVQSCR